MRKYQRGLFGLGVIHLIAGIAILGLITGIVYGVKSYINGVDENGYQRGKAEVMSLWAQESIKADIEERTRYRGLQLVMDEEVGKRQKAEQAAGNYYAKWQREKEDAKRKGLVECLQTPSGSPDVRFTSVFVTTYDSAYTGQDGKQPLFADSVRSAQAAASSGTSVSAYGPGDLLDVHGINAERHSACIRDYTALIDAVTKLKLEWELKR